MLAQRATQLGLRRLAYGGSQASQIAFRRYAAPVAVGTIHARPVATTHLSASSGHEILAAQRKLRPVSPHLTIYQPQIPWILSMSHRLTGIVLSGAFYLFGASYLAAPLLGWHLDSASIAAAFGALPLLAKIALKFTIAMPFTFHGLNGFRHLAWDVGKQFKNITVIRTGWTVVGLSFVSALGLAVFL